MSTLRTNNLQNPDSAGVNIVMTEGGGAIFSGIITAPTLNVTSDLNVAGVLTYDDVTNVDSIGVVTARSGVHVTGGTVGIGTDNPDDKLTVRGSNGSGLRVGDGTANVLLGTGAGPVGRLYTISNHDLIFGTNDSERLRIDSSGRLLTGNISETSVDANGMHIRQSSAGNNLVSLILENHGTTANTSTELKFVPTDASPDDRFNSIKVLDTTGNNQFDTTFLTCEGATPEERLRITSSGRLGIGTINPGQNLTVNGSIESLCQVAVGSTEEGGEFILRAAPQQLTGTKYRYLIDNFYGPGSFGRASDDPVSGIRFVRQDDATSANGVIVCTMDEDGIVRHPYQPIASLTHSGAVNVNNTVLTSSNFYDTTWINQGNHFNASTGRFTCPVAGIYRIYFRMSQNSSNVSTNVRLQKNGNTINEAYARVQYASVSSEVVVQCAAGDFLQIQVADMFARQGTQHKQVTFQLLH